MDGDFVEFCMVKQNFSCPDWKIIKELPMLVYLDNVDGLGGKTPQKTQLPTFYNVQLFHSV